MLVTKKTNCYVWQYESVYFNYREFDNDEYAVNSVSNILRCKITSVWSRIF